MTLHVDIPSRSAVERLLTAGDAPCVSIYLPTSPVTQDAQADRIELKNLAAEATEQLETAGADSYPHLVEPGIPGSPESATDDELAAAARSVLDEVYASELSAIRDRFELRGSDGRASTDIATAARAATYGAVDTLLVDIDQKVPGYVDADSGAVTFDKDDASSYGVVDEIARRVLLSRGRVLAVRSADVPGGGPAAAILRYAL